MLLRELTAEIIPPRSAILANGVVLLVVPEGAVEARLPNLVPPYGTVDVQGPAGPHRIVAWRPSSKYQGDRAPILAAARGKDPLELADDLDPASCRRLLGFLLGFCRTAFTLGNEPRFASVCGRLALLCARDGGTVRPMVQATPAWTVLAGVNAPADAVCYVIGASRVRTTAVMIGRASDGVRLVEPVQDGDLVLALSSDPVVWTVRTTLAPLVDVMQPGASLPANLQALRAACLRTIVPSGPVAALMREMQVLTPAAPRRHDDPARPLGAELEAVLPDGEGGLFIRGWVRDPLHLVDSASLRTPNGTAAIDPAHLHRVRRPDIGERYTKAEFRDDDVRPGFIAHMPDPSSGRCAQPTLILRLSSGNQVELTAPLRHLPPGAARDAVLSCAAPSEISDAMMTQCLAPAAAALHRQALAARPAATVIQLGTPVRKPAVSIIVPLYRNLDFVRFQMAALASDPECRRAELILVLDSPEQRPELEHLLRGLHALHDMPCTLVVLPCNLGYAAANNEAARLARGALLLLLNSDVVPARAGWLGPLRTALTPPGVGAAGPKLLFDDGSIQHAGLFFQRDDEGAWFNAHYHKGMPRHWPAAQRRRHVPGVTGAAFLVRRTLFEAVGGITEDYIIGDYEDSDLCLKLRGAGSDIVYVPQSELYHFERRSISLHAGYTRTLASRYNRQLHHSRWDDTMTALMAERAHRSPA